MVDAESGARVGGIALGRAGDTHREFDEYGKSMERNLQEAWKEIEPAQAAVDRFQEKLAGVNAKLRAGIEAARAEGASQQPLSEEQRAERDALAEKFRRAAMEFHLGGLEMHLRADLIDTQGTLMEFIEMHFRTGFVRFAPASAIRKILGKG